MKIREPNEDGRRLPFRTWIEYGGYTSIPCDGCGHMMQSRLIVQLTVMANDKHDHPMCRNCWQAMRSQSPPIKIWCPCNVPDHIAAVLALAQPMREGDPLSKLIERSL